MNTFPFEFLSVDLTILVSHVPCKLRPIHCIGLSMFVLTPRLAISAESHIPQLLLGPFIEAPLSSLLGRHRSQVIGLQSVE